MWKIIALIGFLQSGDATLLFSVQEYPTKVACTKSIPVFQKGVVTALSQVAHGKVTMAFDCAPSADVYKKKSPPEVDGDTGV